MAMFILIHEGLTLKRIPLEKARIRIGRKTDADIFIDDRLASQNHAAVEKIASTQTPDAVDYYIEDLGSTNQTYVNGIPIGRQKLAHNDVIRIGKHTFKFIDETDDPGDKTAKLHKSWIPGVYYLKE